jgi:phosphoglycolate phosphatase-like HAD superfamily hydrolase
MILLLDLDGTLTDTAHPQFKEMKDGLVDTVLSKIPLIKGAKEFIETQKIKGNIPIIVSDSHPKYVNKIASEIFNIDCISLTDKPNPQKTLSYIDSNTELKRLFLERDNFLMIGDSWLDIELGRRLNIRTVLANFYSITEIEERDGIGQDWKSIKMGPTFYAKNFLELEHILDNQIDNLLALESIFQGGNSIKAVNFKEHRYSNGFVAFRCLARQNDGECDRYARADKYYQIDNPNRTPEFLATLSKGAENYINHVLSFSKFEWDYFTFLTDKSTTTPPNKMKEIFDLVNVEIPKIQMFQWNENIEGNLRNRPDYKSRREFISKNLFIDKAINVKGKSVIILDDQFTSSATAYEISTQLRENGAKNILFIALFYLILPIESKACPNCGKALKIKIKKIDGKRFYSCLSPKFGGQGCGYIENIKE